MTSASHCARWAVRAVVFDLDGVLIDSEPIFAEALRRLLDGRGRQLDADFLSSIMGMPGRQAIPILRTSYCLSEPVAVLIAECRQLFYGILGEGLPPLMPGVLDLMERLERQGLPRAVATSSRSAYARRVLEPHGLFHRFAFVLTADDVARGKPDPEIYSKAAARLGCRPEEMLVLEDSPNGIRSARSAGARCVGVPHPLAPPERLGEAHMVIRNLTDVRLKEILGF